MGSLPPAQQRPVVSPLTLLMTSNSISILRGTIMWFVAITAAAFWAGYDRVDAVALVSSAICRPEAIAFVTVGVIWLAWSIIRHRILDKMV